MSSLRNFLGFPNDRPRTPKWAHVEVSGGTVRILCDASVALDARRVNMLHDYVHGLLESAPGSRVELDLTSVEQADTTLLATLVKLAREARKAGVELVITASASIRKLVRMCRLDPLIAN